LKIDFFDFEIFDLDKSGEVKASGPENADILLVMDGQDYDDNKDLISNIMKAINYDLDSDVRTFILPQGVEINLAELVSEKNKYVIAFGVNPKRISMNASFRANTFYQTEAFEIMLSYALEDLNSNVSYKKGLWKVLQEKFVKK